MTTIFTRAHLLPELTKAWLQHLRDFDTANPGCHFEVMADMPDMSMHDAIEAVRLNPGLTFSTVLEREGQWQPYKLVGLWLPALGDEDNVWMKDLTGFHTREECQAECDRRNEGTS